MLTRYHCSKQTTNSHQDIKIYRFSIRIGNRWGAGSTYPWLNVQLGGVIARHAHFRTF